MPIVEKFQEEGMVRVVDAEQPEEDVWKAVKRLFGPSVIFVLGGPGAGKGTQCKRLSCTFGYRHLSVGDLVREELARPESMHRLEIERHQQNGTLVPSDIVLALLKQ